MVKDLTVGNPQKVLVTFTIPMFISVVFQQLYNIADSVIAGKFAGEDALAAVGASYPITMIFMAVAVGSNVGCSVLISNLFGAKKYEQMKTAVSTTLISAVVLAVLMTVLGLLGTRWLMNMIHTPDNIFGDGAYYLRIYIAGFIFVFLYNIATGVFSALGDSKTPLYFLIGSSIGNILLDLLFVACFHWGVGGVGWATFIAQGAACILALFALKNRIKNIKTTQAIAFYSKEMFGKVCRLAVPSILQQSFVSVGNIFIQSLINQNGSHVIAGYSAAVKLNTFAITSATTLGNGISNFTAQNLGAGQLERVKSGVKGGIKMSAAIAVLFTAAFCAAASFFIQLFMNETSDQLALSTGTQFLYIVSPFYIIIAMKLLFDGVLRGGGAMKSFMAATFTDLFLRVVLAYVLSAHFGVLGIWYSWPIGWTISAVFSAAFYLRGNWKRGIE